MTTTNASSHVSVTVERLAPGEFAITNGRGGRIAFTVGSTDFTPTELLLAAIGGCTAIDVDLVTTRRAEPEAFTVEVGAEKVRGEGGNHLADIAVRFEVRFPAGPEGDAAREVLPGIVTKSHDRLCTVGRTVERGSPITPGIG